MSASDKPLSQPLPSRLSDLSRATPGMELNRVSVNMPGINNAVTGQTRMDTAVAIRGRPLRRATIAAQMWVNRVSDLNQAEYRG